MRTTIKVSEIAIVEDKLLADDDILEACKGAANTNLKSILKTSGRKRLKEKLLCLKDDEGSSPLILAGRHMDPAEIKLMIDVLQDDVQEAILAVNECGENALMAACSTRDQDPKNIYLLLAALKEKARQALLAQDKAGLSAFYYACSFQENVVVVKLALLLKNKLLQACSACDNQGYNALMVICERYDVDMLLPAILRLLGKGAGKLMQKRNKAGGAALDIVKNNKFAQDFLPTAVDLLLVKECQGRDAKADKSDGVGMFNKRLKLSDKNEYVKVGDFLTKHQ